jgi:DNA invertase Pin-like site-specific DNA recombinase
VLLSFAQFEREIFGGRIRDKVAASKHKGMWMGGTNPLGYDVRDRRLYVNQVEAQKVKHIFERYLELAPRTDAPRSPLSGKLFDESRYTCKAPPRASGAIDN